MAHAYQAVGWNRQKRVYDAVVAGGVLLYLAAFLGAGAALFPDATAETLAIRALGTCAFLLLHVVLSIGPLCRLDRRFLPLLYNRRHLGVVTFLVALSHGLFALVQFHALGDVDPLTSLISSNLRFDSVAQFPFQQLGLAALLVLFLMAATSHDFWLANLTAPTWKALHMGVYAAYALVVMHVALGVLQAETSQLYALALGAGLVWIVGLHLAAARRERRVDALDRARSGAEGFVDACAAAEIPDGRARVVAIGGERVAIFRHAGRVFALSSVCQHQNGPLGEGCVRDGLVTCPWHGYQYRPDDGASPPPFTEKVPTFRVRVAGERVLVDPHPLPPGTRAEPPRIEGEAAPAPERGELYVGYEPRAPAALARFVRPRVALLLVVSTALGALLAAAQRPFSKAAFEYGTQTTLVGWIEERPYPTLVVERPGVSVAPAVSRYLLVAPGKHGADDLVSGLEGRHVRARGTLVHRDDQTMLELVSGGIEPSDGPSAPSSAPSTPVEPIGEHTLEGEIVDSKCFLGVMKPGSTKPHRDCATRCISGGIPPVLCVRDENGGATYFLLVDPAGGPVGRRVVQRALVAEPVRITGEVLREGDRLVLRADPERYERIDG